MKEKIQKLALVILGNTIYCIGVVAFILPLELITGGTTGLGLIINHFANVPLEIFTGIFNITMFILAWFVLGAGFALTTMVSTFYYPVILGVFQRVEFFNHLTDDPLLGTICAGLLIGVGLGIVIRAGASTGGMDIPPLIINKKTGLSVAFLLNAFDIMILFLQMSFSNKEQILYGILMVLIYTYVLDKILVSGKSKVQIKIISEKYLEINNAIAKTNNTGKVKFSTAIQSDTYKNLINRTLGDKDRATRFVANISSAVAINPDLQECDAGTILSGALLGESLNLSPSPNLGQFYLVPFNDTKNKRKVAQFQIGLTA